MQFLGSASTAHNPVVDIPAADERIDVGGACTATTTAADAMVGDQTVAAAQEKDPYVPAIARALGPRANMDHDASPSELDIGGGSYEDLIASGVNEFFDLFRTLTDGGFPEGGLNAADQGMEVDDDELAWLNSPDAFMPLPIADSGGLCQAPATVVTAGGEEKEEVTGMGPGRGNETLGEDLVGTPPVAVDWAVPEATPEAALAPAAAAEGAGIAGGEYAVTPAPAYGFSGGGAGYMCAGGAPDGAADVDAVDVGISAAESVAVTAVAANMTKVNGGGGGQHNGDLVQKELIRRQKVERYLAKKKRRRWSRASSYQSRQRVANNRPRHKGRFLPLVSDFVPISELKRRQRARMVQQAAGEEDGQVLIPKQEAPTAGWGASAQFPGVGQGKE